MDRLNDYQAAARRTRADSPIVRTLWQSEQGILVAALGLAGEAGEFADHVKKWLAQGHDLDYAQLDKEAGDILWYLARYADARGTQLSTLAQMNIDKLRERYPDGFTTDRSLNRGDE
jgi:NTP pyrophosphatase (non-canonical NTP hydrolase)